MGSSKWWAAGILLLAASFGRGGAASPAGAADFVHGCLHINGLVEPSEVAQRFAAAPRGERRSRFVTVLRQDAEEKARPLVQQLRDLQVKDVLVLWGPGVVCATAPRGVWKLVSESPEAGPFFEDPPQPDEAVINAADEPNRSVPPEAPLVALHVPEAWDRGLTGSGVVIAHIDTGINLTHPDLVNQLWVNPGEIPNNGIDDDGNGYVDDVNGYDFEHRTPTPTDVHGHGTNTAGLLVGNGASGKQTGVAPGAKLMVLRRNPTQAGLWEASQYAIANGADVISQSISWQWSFSTRPDYASWRRQTDAELAAGLVHVNSAGNNGASQTTDPIPYNIGAPANCPPPWLPPDQTLRGGVSSVIAVGDVDARSLVITADSSYGPAEWTDIKAHRDASYPYVMPPAYQDYPEWGGSPGLLKPDFVAQGDNSLTTALAGGYETFGGTSASAPRVAGIVALMLQAVPTATPADIYQALVNTARDLGPAGRDNRYGAGLPDADAAIDANGPPLFVATTQVLDGGPPQADGDGGADAGEIDRLSVTIQNTSSQALGDVDLVLSAVSNVFVRDGYARLTSVPAGGQTSTTTPHFGIEFPANACNLTAELQLEIRQGGRRRVESIFILVGTETRTTLQSTDFETDPGFTVSGTATAGAWVRAIPVGTVKNGQQANPPADHTPPPGVMCYVTGNGPTDPDAADVDGGRTILTSPPRDARGFRRVELTYYRWFYTSDQTGQDRYLVEATGDGATWKTLEEVTAFENIWRKVSIVLSDLVTPGATTQVRFSVEDAGVGTTVEGGLDDYSLVGVGSTCSPWTIPSNPPPSPVGATLRLARAPGGNLRLTWDPPSAHGGVDPAHGYTVTKSTHANGGFAEVARPATTNWVELGGMSPAGGRRQFYLVESLTASP